MSTLLVFLGAICLVGWLSWLAQEMSTPIHDIVARWRWILAFVFFLALAWPAGQLLTWSNGSRATWNPGSVAVFVLVVAWSGAVVTGIAIVKQRSTVPGEEEGEVVSSRRVLTRFIGWTVVALLALWFLGLLLVGLGFAALSKL